MSEWKKCKLGDVAEIQTGPFGSQLHASDYIESGIPSIMPTNIGTRLEINKTDIACISDNDAKRLNRYLVDEGDVVYSRRGDVEKCAYISHHEKGWLCGTGCLRIRFNKQKVIPKYCAYYLTTAEIKGWISGQAVGTTMPNLNSSILANVPIILPPLPEQRAIASVLSSLDDKIDLLHRQNKTLEEMAEVLFRQWFVEEADEGWEEAKLIDIAEHKKVNIKPNDNPDKIYQHYSIPAFDENHHPVIEPGSEIQSNKYRVFPNSILISKLNPRFPRVWAIPSIIPDNSICSTEFQVIMPLNNEWYGYIYCLLKSRQVSDELIGAAGGTSGSHQRVKPEDIFNIVLQKPDIKILKKFNEATSKYWIQIQDNYNRIMNLEMMRNVLLPKLMSGEVRV